MGVVYRAWQPSLGRQVALKRVSHADDPVARTRLHREIRALGRADHPHLVKILTSGFDNEPPFYTMELVEGATLAAVCTSLQARSSAASGVDLATWRESLSTACAGARQDETPLSDGGHDAPAHPRPAAAPHAAPAAGDRGYVRQVVELVRQAALAADALHAQGVIHRDIKPDNIMVTADGTEAILMDLGLAQLADEAEGRLTRTRQFVGTLRYASPEQVNSVGMLDRRSDVFSLGATLWELLTLRPLYGATDAMSTPELMRRIGAGAIEPIRKYHPGLARDLESIVFKCLESEPTRRYATAADLARDLSLWLRDKPVTAQPQTTRYLLGKMIRRHRWPIAAATAAIVLALAGLIGDFYRVNRLYGELLKVNDRLKIAKEAANDARDRAERARVDAEAQRDDARHQKRRAQRTADIAADAVDQFFATVSENDLINVPNMEPLRGKFLDLAIKHLDDLRKEQGEDKGEDAKLRTRVAQAHFYVGRMYERLAKWDEAVGEYSVALGAQAELLAAAPRDVPLRCDRAQTGRRLGLCYIMMPGMKDRARAALEEARDALIPPGADRAIPAGSADPAVDFELARIYNALGFVDNRIGKPAAGAGAGGHSARDDYEMARSILRHLIRRTGPGDPHHLEYEHQQALNAVNLGNLDRNEGHAEDAATSYRAAEAFWKGQVGGDRQGPGAPTSNDPDYLAYCRSLAQVSENLVALELARGQLDEALASGAECCLIAGRLAEKFHYDEFQNAQARSFLYRGELSLERRRRAERLGDRGGADRWEGKIREDVRLAEAIYEELAKAPPKGGNAPEADQYRNGLGWCHLLRAASYPDGKQHEAAEAELAKALDIFAGLNRAEPGHHEYQARLAMTWRRLGDVHAALALEARGRGAAAAAADDAEADAAYRRACAIAEDLIKRHKHFLYRSQAGLHHCYFARFLNKAHDFQREGAGLGPEERARNAEAEADLSIGILSDVLAKDASDDKARLHLSYALQERALARAHRKDHAGAAEDAEAALHAAEARAGALKGQETPLPVPLLYGLAAAYAQAAKAAPRDPRPDKGAEPYAERAVKLLVELEGRQLFADPAWCDRLAKDPDFQPLRSHARYLRIAHLAGPAPRAPAR